jgi:hypothetical protein
MELGYAEGVPWFRSFPLLMLNVISARPRRQHGAKAGQLEGDERASSQMEVGSESQGRAFYQVGQALQVAQQAACAKPEQEGLSRLLTPNESSPQSLPRQGRDWV